MKQTSTKSAKKFWRSSAAQRFLKLADGAETVEDAIARVTLMYLDGVKCPPTDLESVGKKLGITGFESADIAGSGELRIDGDGYRIFYSKHLRPEARHFTIAHEMGHAVLERTGPPVPRSGKELEHLCDLFAANLLMPKSIFLQCASGEISTQRIFELARQFKTSVNATSTRFAELCRISVLACEELRVIWRRGAYRIAPNSLVDESLRPAILRALGGEASTDEVFLGSTSFQRWHVDCRSFGSGRTVLCLLKPLSRGDSYRTLPSEENAISVERFSG